MGGDTGHVCLPVLLCLDEVHCAVGPGRYASLVEAAAAAEEGVLLVIVNRPALVALADLFPGVAVDAGVGRYRGAAAGTLEGPVFMFLYKSLYLIMMSQIEEAHLEGRTLVRGSGSHVSVY